MPEQRYECGAPVLHRSQVGKAGRIRLETYKERQSADWLERMALAAVLMGAAYIFAHLLLWVRRGLP